MNAKSQKEGKKATENGAIDYLISSGLEKHDSGLEASSLKVYLSESQEKKIEEYCQVFGVSVRTMLNSCIQYMIFLSDNMDIEVKNMPEYPKRLGSSCYDLLLNIETLAKLKKSGVEEIEEACKYAVAGIKVLYKKNLNIRKKSSNRDQD